MIVKFIGDYPYVPCWADEFKLLESAAALKKGTPEAVHYFMKTMKLVKRGDDEPHVLPFEMGEFFCRFLGAGFYCLTVIVLQ